MTLQGPSPSPNEWSEDASAIFLELAEIFVPARAEQIDALVKLIPASVEEEFTVVELASGEGKLAEAILEHFPRCHLLALDGSETMRTSLQQRLSRFEDRLEVRHFELADLSWRTGLPSPLRAVLCSLSVHHLDAAGKRRLFSDMKKRLERGGALLLADVVMPANQRIADLFAQQYDEIVRAQSLAQRGDLSGFEEFEKQKWNWYRYDYGIPDQYDKPSRLYEQLGLLEEVTFSTIDVFWMRAGHAIFGGYK